MATEDVKDENPIIEDIPVWPLVPSSVDANGIPNSEYFFIGGLPDKDRVPSLCGNNPFGGKTMMDDPVMGIMASGMNPKGQEMICGDAVKVSGWKMLSIQAFLATGGNPAATMPDENGKPGKDFHCGVSDACLAEKDCCPWLKAQAATGIVYLGGSKNMAAMGWMYKFGHKIGHKATGHFFTPLDGLMGVGGMDMRWASGGEPRPDFSSLELFSDLGMKYDVDGDGVGDTEYKDLSFLNKNLMFTTSHLGYKMQAGAGANVNLGYQASYGANPYPFENEELWRRTNKPTPKEAFRSLNKCVKTLDMPEGGPDHIACTDGYNFRPRMGDGSHPTLGHNKGSSLFTDIVEKNGEKVTVSTATEMWLMFFGTLTWGASHMPLHLINARAVEIALQYANDPTKNHFPNLRKHNVTIGMALAEDTDSQLAPAQKALQNTLPRIPDKTVAVTGLYAGNECDGVIPPAAALGFPTFSGGCYDMRFNDKDTYPMLLRTLSKTTGNAKVVYALLSALGIRRLAYIADPLSGFADPGNAAIEILEKENADLEAKGLKPKWNIAYKKRHDQYEGTDNGRVIGDHIHEQVVTTLKSMDIRFVLLAMLEPAAADFLCQAKLLGFVGKHYFVNVVSLASVTTVGAYRSSRGNRPLICSSMDLYKIFHGQYLGLGMASWNLDPAKQEQSHDFLPGVSIGEIRKHYIARQGTICDGSTLETHILGIPKWEDCWRQMGPQTFEATITFVKALDQMMGEGWVPDDFSNDPATGRPLNLTSRERLFEVASRLEFFGVTGDVKFDESGDRQNAAVFIQFDDYPGYAEFEARQPHNPRGITKNSPAPMNSWVHDFPDPTHPMHKMDGRISVHPWWPAIMAVVPHVTADVMGWQQSDGSFRWGKPLLFRGPGQFPDKITYHQLDMENLFTKLAVAGDDESEREKVHDWVREKYFRDRPLDCTGIPHSEAVLDPETGIETCERCKAGYGLTATEYSLLPDYDYEKSIFPKCVPAAPGYYSNDGIVKKCEAGSYSGKAGATGCEKCGEGEFQADRGSVQCLECPPGSFAKGEGNSRCTGCPEGQFSDDVKQSSCKTCPAGLTTITSGAFAQSHCMCSEGMYSPCLGVGGDMSELTFDSYTNGKCAAENLANTCEPCPTGMRCRGHALAVSEEIFARIVGKEDVMEGYDVGGISYNGPVAASDGPRADSEELRKASMCVFGTPPDENQKCVHAPPLPQEKYWTSLDNTYRAFKCHYMHRCQPGGFERCGDNWSGFVCAECDHGYAIGPSDDNAIKASCQKCSETSQFALMPGLLGLGLCACLWAYRLSVMNRQLAGRMAIAAGFGMMLQNLQYLTVMESFAVPWPGTFGDVLSAITIFSFDLGSVSAGCTVGNNPLIQSVWRLTVPLFAVIAVFSGGRAGVALLPRVFAKPFLDAGEKPIFVSDAAVNAVGIIFFVLFIPMCVSILSVFQCYSHPAASADYGVNPNTDWSQDESSLVAFPQVLCGSTDHIPLIIVGFGAVVAYVILPLIYLRRVVKAGQSNPGEFNPIRYYFLCGRFGISHMQWALYSIFRNSVLAFIPVIVGDNNPGLQLVLFSVWCTLWAIAVLYKKPWRIYFLNLMDACILIGLALAGGWSFNYLESTKQTDSIVQAGTLGIVILCFLGIIAFVTLFIVAEFAPPLSVKKFSERTSTFRYTLTGYKTGKVVANKDSSESALQKNNHNEANALQKNNADAINEVRGGEGALTASEDLYDSEQLEKAKITLKRSESRISFVVTNLAKNMKDMRPEFGDPDYEEEQRLRRQLAEAKKKRRKASFGKTTGGLVDRASVVFGGSTGGLSRALVNSAIANSKMVTSSGSKGTSSRIGTRSMRPGVSLTLNALKAKADKALGEAHRPSLYDENNGQIAVKEGLPEGENQLTMSPAKDGIISPNTTTQKGTLISLMEKPADFKFDSAFTPVHMEPEPSSEKSTAVPSSANTSKERFPSGGNSEVQRSNDGHVVDEDGATEV